MRKRPVDRGGSHAPTPSVMPVDRESWARELHLANFVNSYFEYRDLSTLPSPCKSVLLVGAGNGLEALVLRWRGFEVETFDIDATFRPDHLGSVHDLSRFRAQQFDALIASHVLEHLAEPFLDRALEEIARVARFALIYLPVAGRHAQLRVQPGFKNKDWQIVIDLFDFFSAVDGVTPRYMSGQHFWEVGRRGFSVRALLRRFERQFEILRHYRNREWLPSYNFVLGSKAAGGSRGSVLT